MQRLIPGPPSAVPLADVYVDLALPAGVDGTPPRPYVIVNMVMTLDGKTQLHGNAAGIGSETDHQLMRHLRSNVDVVLNGAGTLRADNVVVRLPPDLQRRRQQRGDVPNPRYAIVTRSGDLPLERRAFDLDPPPIVFVGAGAERLVEAIRQRAEVVVLPDETAAARTILVTLRERFGARRVLLEGGPTLNQVFLEEGLVDELFLTLAPRIFGGPPGRPIVVGQRPLPTPVLGRLASAYGDGDELFLRYTVGNKQSSDG